jgi:hypothetical protein
VKKKPTPAEFPKLQAGSLRAGFTVIYNDKIRKIESVDKRKSTIRIIFEDKYDILILNDLLIEVVVKNRKERKAQNGKHKRSVTRR